MNVKIRERLDIPESPINYTFIDKICLRDDDYRWTQTSANTLTLKWVISLVRNQSACIDFGLIPTSSSYVNKIEYWSNESINFWNTLIDNQTFGLVAHSWTHSKPYAISLNYKEQLKLIEKSKLSFLYNLGWCPQGFVEAHNYQDYTTSQVLRDLGFSYVCGLLITPATPPLEFHRDLFWCEDFLKPSRLKSFEELKSQWNLMFNSCSPSGIHKRISHIYSKDFIGITFHSNQWRLPEHQHDFHAFIQYINSNYVNVWKCEWMTNWEYHKYIADIDFWDLRKVSESRYRLSLQGMKYDHTVRWDLPGRWEVIDVTVDKFVTILTVPNNECPFDSWHCLPNHIYEVTYTGQNQNDFGVLSHDQKVFHRSYNSLSHDTSSFCREVQIYSMG